MNTRETTAARLYALTWNSVTHELAATSARDLAAQVQAITSSKQAAGLARAAWGDDQADLQLAGVRLVAVGRIVRQVWRSVAVNRTPGTVHSVSDSSDSNASNTAAPDITSTANSASNTSNDGSAIRPALARFRPVSEEARNDSTHYDAATRGDE
ncbi:hypothetical protein GCM10008959_40940 [Deinococcus seoulensis]|uniref:Uncharacterized protein n=1 Tax=Deinococcus seoulensis TaxID=1837379 RepID=A0ABQ2RZ98_9DEIO|nr:hypothetical protein [Deinococcus seoulensis]GGR75771.1 hypothetical protein GCM10008959_40940 [Deinococcus seoulensis]